MGELVSAHFALQRLLHALELRSHGRRLNDVTLLELLGIRPRGQVPVDLVGRNVLLELLGGGRERAREAAIRSCHGSDGTGRQGTGAPLQSTPTSHSPVGLRMCSLTLSISSWSGRASSFSPTFSAIAAIFSTSSSVSAASAGRESSPSRPQQARRTQDARVVHLLERLAPLQRLVHFRCSKHARKRSDRSVDRIGDHRRQPTHPTRP